MLYLELDKITLQTHLAKLQIFDVPIYELLVCCRNFFNVWHLLQWQMLMLYGFV